MSVLFKTLLGRNRLLLNLSKRTVATCLVNKPPQLILQAATLNPSINRGLHNSTSLCSNLLYTKTHEWVKVEDNVGTIGITDYAQTQLGDIVYCELPEVGASFEKGDPFATIESVKAASDLYIPVSGEIVERNDLLEEASGLINESPLDEGWIVKVQLSESGQDEIKELLSEEEYKKHKEAEADD